MSAVQQAQREIGACLSREAAARQALRTAEGEIERRLQRARSGGDADVEAFAIWLKEGRQTVATAEAACTAAEAETAQARAALRLARAGERKRRRSD